MRKVLVTGFSGFIGKNLVVALRRRADTEVLEFEIADGQERLEKVICVGVELVYHLASVNRPTDVSEFTRSNVDLTSAIAGLVKSCGHDTSIVFSSSTQPELDNPY